MLVVLVVVAALTGLAVPATGRLAASFRLASERQQVERQLRELPLTMRQSGRDGLLTEGEAPPAMIRLTLDLPKDWSLHTERPIRYHFTGACDGGEVVISRSSEHWHYQLTPPLCRPRQIDAAGR